MKYIISILLFLLLIVSNLAADEKTGVEYGLVPSFDVSLDKGIVGGVVLGRYNYADGTIKPF